jgi:outer membrane protein
MKNLSLILNGVLLVAVVVLYYLHFKPGTGDASASETSTTIQPGELKVAYINSDTVLKYYDYFKVNRELLEAKSRKMDTDFKNRAQSLQKDIASYQNNVGNLTINQAKAIEEDIGRKQQNLRMYQESLATELGNEEGKLNLELYDRVTKYLKEYGDENNIHMVIKFDPTSDLLFGNNALDITQDVIVGLNTAYNNEKNTTKSTAVDSTSVRK